MEISRKLRAGTSLVAAGALTAALFATASPAGAVPPDQVARGETVWSRACVECHGPDSTNLDAPLLLRPNSLRRFATAAAAFKYVSEKMPEDNPGSLPPEEYWDVLAFLLAQQGLAAGDAPLGPDIAESVPTRIQAGPPASAPSAEDEGAAPTSP